MKPKFKCIQEVQITLRRTSQICRCSLISRANTWKSQVIPRTPWWSNSLSWPSRILYLNSRTTIRACCTVFTSTRLGTNMKTSKKTTTIQLKHTKRKTQWWYKLGTPSNRWKEAVLQERSTEWPCRARTNRLTTKTEWSNKATWRHTIRSKTSQWRRL